jgi:light-regulated signal transduction histidine kinase (bacteriophytochrome)
VLRRQGPSRGAFKYTSHTADARVRLGAAEQDGVPVYFVADNGAGFDMAHTGQLFLPFHRLHRRPRSSSPAPNGLGTEARFQR